MTVATDALTGTVLLPLDPATVLPSEASARTYLNTVATQIEAAGVSAAAVVRSGS
jgi:hypothetical protein